MFLLLGTPAVTFEFLAYLFDTIGPHRGIRFFVLTDAGEFAESTSADLRRRTCPLVTYNVSSIVDGERPAVCGWLNRLIDIDTALSLSAGLSRAARGDVGGRSFLEMLVHSDTPEFKPYLAYCLKGDRSASDATLMGSVACVARRLCVRWSEEVTTLLAKGEWARFLHVEVPVSRVLHRRQASGIRVDEEVMERDLRRLGNDVASARQQLRSRFGILDPDDQLMVTGAIERDSLLSGVIEDYENSWQVDSLLKLYSDRSELAAALRAYTRASRSRRVLLRCGALDCGRVYPDYESMGTVTGRIIVRNPALQNLTREYRSILCPDGGMVLLYPDYRQCEPGILADDCEDEQFQRDYSSGDVYEALASALLGSGGSRDAAKLLFLFVCYGMATDRIVRIAADSLNLSVDRAGAAIDGFFSRYRGITAWREQLLRDIRKDGRIGTRLGNYRYFTSGTPDSRALRWAQSQRIQGTASLILKTAIVEIERCTPEIDILLPMHDALLVQVPEGAARRFQVRLAEILVDCYRRFCPTVGPRVAFNPFGDCAG